MTARLVWRVEPQPAGRYRTFAKRGFPSATYDTSEGDCAANLSADESYDPRTCETVEVTIRIADYRGHTRGFTWRILKQRATGVTAAKMLVQRWLNDNAVTLRTRGPIQ